MIKMHESWNPIRGLLYQEPLTTLNEKILPEIAYYPEPKNIFNVFEIPVNSIKVVILGQDPYFSPKQANGLAFAVNEDIPIPPSLRIILNEINNEHLSIKDSELQVNNIDIVKWKTLKHWQEQGIFLLNTALTVEAGKAGSHLKYWEDFTRKVISHISVNQPCIWLLWGEKARRFTPYILKKQLFVSGYSKETIEYIPISEDYNYILTAPHPAAEAYSDGKAGFYGCNHFHYVNSILKNKKLNEIKW